MHKIINTGGWDNTMYKAFSMLSADAGLNPSTPSGPPKALLGMMSKYRANYEP